MKEIHFTPDAFPKLAILIKEAACAHTMLTQHYVQYIGFPVVALSLEYGPNNKVTAGHAKEYLKHILPTLLENEIKTLYVADAAYFKVLTKQAKTEPHYGYVLPCAIKGYENLNIIYGVNYQALFHKPDLQVKLDLSLKTVNDHLHNRYKEIGKDIIHKAKYPKDSWATKNFIDSLFDQPQLTCDIETYGLDLAKAIPATIGFATDQHNGGAFNLGRLDVQEMLVKFFQDYKGTLIYHNASFDIKCLIHHLFMKDNMDYVGMVDGLDVMCRSIHDTKIIAYLCTNSTAGNDLKLKSLASEFAGNYAKEDIKDITKIPRKELLEYNLVDCLSTWFVFNKYYPMLKDEDQLGLYKDLFLPSIKNIIHMELVGMPLHVSKVRNLGYELSRIQLVEEQKLHESDWVKDTEWQIQREEFLTANLALKTKVRSMDEFAHTFNPGSSKQAQTLIYDVMGLDPIDLTPTGEAAVGAKTLKKLIKKLQREHGITDEDIKP